LLRESEYTKDFQYEDVLQLAQSSKGKDVDGYRIEFINMVKSLNAIALR
jgi:Ca-activated chloride channel homolog